MATLELRKVIDLGQGSLIITLPRPWLRRHGVKKGDTLEVLTGEGELVVRILRMAPEVLEPGPAIEEMTA